MLCENCLKRVATTHIKRTVNGVTKEHYLCPQCAAELGLGGFNLFEDASNFWNSFFNSNTKLQNNTKRCKSCNTSFSEIIDSGKMGCPDCYSEFREEIMPTLVKIHGKAEHKGLSPETKQSDSSDDGISSLEIELKKAIENEEFEKAAEIRDKIREMRDKNE